MSNVKLIWITPDSEKIIGYCARVSSPQNQNNPDVSNLLSYCIKHKHWSIFEMANFCVSIETTRAISSQILRHRSFSFQEFSQRYATVMNFDLINPRKQAEKNRQSSTNDLPLNDFRWFQNIQTELGNLALEKYNEAIERGIAKESARFLLPMSTETSLFMQGTIRSWIHYLQLRTEEDVQLEHREIAISIKEIFKKELPIISAALAWTK